MSGQSFFVEDVVNLRSQPSKVGLVERTFHDVDSHIADPLRDYKDGIKRHKDIPKRLYTSFLGTGIPPRDHVVVTWYLEGTELVPEAKLNLMDRSLLEGDVVKRRLEDTQSGTVLRTSMRCVLRPPCPWPEPQSLAKPSRDAWTQCLRDTSSFLLDVPSEELDYALQYAEGTIIMYKDFVGVVDEVTDEVTLRLCNGSAVVIEDTEVLIVAGKAMDVERHSVGELVETTKGTLRTGRWKYGAYNPNIEPVGYVAEVRTTSLQVRWLHLRQDNAVQGDVISATPVPRHEPPSLLELDDMNSGTLAIYDRSRGPSPRNAKTTYSGSDRSHPYIAGNFVRFRDLAGASVKYSSDSGVPHRNLYRIPRTKTLGYDINAFEVMSTKTRITVLWQDQSVSEHDSTELVPDPNVDDEDEVWPGEIVITAEHSEVDQSGTFTPAKVGVVQKVRSSDRVASVRWFADPFVEIIDQNRTTLSPSSRTGPIGDLTEVVSLYEIASTSALNHRLGDLVILRSIPEPESRRLDWFGEIVELGLDGLLTVRLGALEDVLDIRIPPEQILWSYASEDDSDDESEDGSGGDPPDYEDPPDYAVNEDRTPSDVWMHSDSDEEPEDSDEEDVQVIERTIEYDGGQRLDQDSDDDMWSTENEEQDENDEDTETEDTFVDAQSSLDVVMADDNDGNDEGDQKHERGVASEQASTEDKEMPRNNARSSGRNALELLTASNAPASFSVLDSEPPADHPYIEPISPIRNTRLRRIQSELKILQSSLPEGIFVRTWESRLDLLRVLIIGPVDTPYEFAPFIMDFRLGPKFPDSPPEAHFHSWTLDGKGPINPNLYEDGTICLSLLGTWHRDAKSEGWLSSRSTVLQVLVSLLGLVLVKEPYFNEAGFEAYAGTEQSRIPSALYSERTYFRSRAFILHALQHPVPALEDEINWVYLSRAEGAPRLLNRAIESAGGVIGRSVVRDAMGRRMDGELNGEASGMDEGERRISVGAVAVLRRYVDAMVRLRDERGG